MALALLALLAMFSISPSMGQFNLGSLDLGNLGALMGAGGGTSHQPQTLAVPAGGDDDLGIGRTVNGILNRVGMDDNFSERVEGLINGMAARYFAPDPNSPIPPHVQRRVMRFCSRHPNDPQCRAHPEFVVKGPVPQGADLGLDDMFPGLTSVQIPPVPSLSLQNFLAGVPDQFRSYIPETFDQLDAEVRQAVESVCGSVNCLKQKPEWLNQRAAIAEQEAHIAKALAPNRPMSEIDRDVEVRMARTHQVKKALIRKAGLEGKVEPANDGLYQHDILLTEPQANALITEINQNKVGFGVGTMGRRKRAGSSIFFETGPFQRWPSGRPILYTFDPNLPEYNRETIRAAIREIQSRSCLNFQEIRTRPSGPHLYYLKNADPAMCGSSPIGMVQSPYINVIRLSFQCADPKGVAIHETLHSLGLGHEHQRIDRDSFIRVNLANVYPQHHSAFYLAGVSTTTSYGIPYDYGSIMHYEGSRGSMNGRKTMTAKTNPAFNDPKMGQRRGLSNSDVEMLRRMYCMPHCNDNFVYCGVWATNGLCQLPHTQVWMIQNCRKSCNMCAMRG